NTRPTTPIWPPLTGPPTSCSPDAFLPHALVSPAALAQSVVPPTAWSVPAMTLSLLSSLFSVPHTMLSPPDNSVFAVPHTMFVAHAFARGLMYPPASRWLPQMICRLHMVWTGIGVPAPLLE